MSNPQCRQHAQIRVLCTEEEKAKHRFKARTYCNNNVALLWLRALMNFLACSKGSVIVRISAFWPRKGKFRLLKITWPLCTLKYACTARWEVFW